MLELDDIVTIPTIKLPGPLDIELELINHLVIKESVEFVIRDGVSTDILYTPKYKAIYVFVQGYYSETGQIPTPAVLQSEFKIEISEPQSTINWVVDKLRERYQRNQIQDLALQLADLKDTASAMDTLVNKTIEIQKNSQSQRHIWAAGDSSLFLSNLQEKILQGHYQGLPLGFSAVDNFTGGLKPGYLAFIAARPKRMKTFFVLKAFIAQKLAGHRPVLFPLENTVEEVMLRISCLLSGYPWDLAMRGIIDTKGWNLLEKTWKEFDALGPHWIIRPPYEERTVGSLMLQADKLDADSVIISQFYNIEPSNTTFYNRPDHEKWGSIAIDLKDAATRPGKERPIYVEAQLNREGDSLEEFSDMSLSQLGLSDKIGQVSDIVFALYQSKELRDNQQIQFGIIEARNTDKSSWYIHSEFKTSTYLELLN